jgi:hypothetical protein
MYFLTAQQHGYAAVSALHNLLPNTAAKLIEMIVFGD